MPGNQISAIYAHKQKIYIWATWRSTDCSRHLLATLEFDQNQQDKKEEVTHPQLKSTGGGGVAKEEEEASDTLSSGSSPPPRLCGTVPPPFTIPKTHKKMTIFSKAATFEPYVVLAHFLPYKRP